MIIESFARSRRARIALVSGLVVFGAWSFSPYVLAEVSTQATVNAPVVRLTAAVDGTVALLPAAGHYYSDPVSIHIVNPSGDTGDLGQIEAEGQLAAATLTMAERQLAEIRDQERRLSARASTFASATLDRLAADRLAAQAAARACHAEVAERNAALTRAQQLYEKQFMSQAGMERARTAAVLSSSLCDSQQARLQSVNATIGAAGRGVFLGDGFNDAPYAEQQKDRLLLQRQQLEATAVGAAARRDDAQRRLKEARGRTDFKAPSGTYVWAQLASPGAAVRAGEPVLDLIDCRRRFVEVALPERRAEVVKVGNEAQIRLIGSDQWLTGRVARVAGAAAKKGDGLFAAVTSALPDAREISVEVALPDSAAIAPERKCDVGRLAEVRFSRYR